MSEANNKVRSAVKIYDFGNGVRFLYPLNYGGKYLNFICTELFKNAECGIFGADMKVSLENDGPFTLVLDSKEILGM